jgi:hypothetical protein
LEGSVLKDESGLQERRGRKGYAKDAKEDKKRKKKKEKRKITQIGFNAYQRIPASCFIFLVFFCVLCETFASSASGSSVFRPETF